MCEFRKVWVTISSLPHPLPSNLPICLEQTACTRIAAWWALLVSKYCNACLDFWCEKKPRGPTTVRGCSSAAAMGVSEARINVESINYARTLAAPFPLLRLVADKMVLLRVASVSAYRVVQLFPASSSGCYARLSRCFHAYCATFCAGARYIVSVRPTRFLSQIVVKSARVIRAIQPEIWRSYCDLFVDFSNNNRPLNLRNYSTMNYEYS